MKIFIVGLFPETLSSALEISILGRSVKNGSITPVFIKLSDYSIRPTRRVDDRVYGGGSGTLLQCEPIALAIDEILESSAEKPEIFVMSPGWEMWLQASAQEVANSGKDIIILCGHYEWIDERVIEYYNMRRISIGDYILTGGESAALIIIDSIARLVPGVIKDTSHQEESFSESFDGKIEYPHYTRPEVWRDMSVPNVLLSWDHRSIAEWRSDSLRSRDTNEER